MASFAKWKMQDRKGNLEGVRNCDSPVSLAGVFECVGGVILENEDCGDE